MTQFITIKEIRVINGLSRGAALPLETPLYVGSNPDCEIYLADPGIADRHLLLELDETGKVTILDLTKAEAIPIEQAESSMFQAGDVKLLWCESDKSWEASVAASQEHQPRSSQSETSLSTAVALRRSRNLRTVALVSCAVVILAILTATALRSGAVKTPVATGKTSSVKRLTPVELSDLRLKIEGRLQTQTFPHLAVAARQNGVQITGFIRAEQQQELETLVASIKKENPLVRIALQLTDSPMPALPFEIVGMVGGLTPSVLIASGQSLYIGSESDGYTLVSMSGVCLTFEQSETHQRLKQCLDQSLPHR